MTSHFLDFHSLGYFQEMYDDLLTKPQMLGSKFIFLVDLKTLCNKTI